MISHMDWKAAEKLCDAIGVNDSRSFAAITRALSYLGITTSYPESDEDDHDNHISKYNITLDISTDEITQDVCQAEFDVESRKWRVIKPGKRYTDASSNQVQEYIGPSQGHVDKDWTDMLPASSHVQFLLSRDWSASPLGPMRDWSVTLQLMTYKMLADPRPACLYWGKDRVAIYNEPFTTIAYSRHPAMMGAQAKDAMPATWPFLYPMFNEVERSGVAFSAPEFEMEVHKQDDFLEEAWYDGIWSPIKGLDGSTEGFYNSGYEITRLKILDRRNRLLHKISSPPNFHEKNVWQHILDSCVPFERDVPMLIVYSANSENMLQSSGCCLQLEGSLGIPENHQAIPQTWNLDQGSHDLAAAFRAGKTHGSPTLLEMPNGRLPKFLDGIEWRGFGEPATHVVILPLFVTGLIAGFVVVGLNPRRPYDEDHKQFVDDFAQLSTSVISESISFAQARAREAQLSKELSERQKFVQKLASVASVGIYSISAADSFTFVNARFHDITGLSNTHGQSHDLSFLDCILAEDQGAVISALEACRSQKTNISIDVRLKRKWTPPKSKTEEPCWVLNSITPNIEGGEVTGVIGCITDITHAMWALKLQKELAEAALEAKRQQEKFIDMTSHEMRNPLGAVMQCADMILNSVEKTRQSCKDHDMIDLLDDLHHSAQTILFCTAHQKRVIDDILTVSKLDSTLLVFTPVFIQPAIVVQESLQMFESELQAADITFSYTLNDSYNITWAHCDPTRLTQILINLLTNAIKFTKTASKRRIDVTIGTSNAAPPPDLNELQWFPRQGEIFTEVCSGEDVFLTFTVKDTGPGMSTEGMDGLFNRFVQASPMTHIKYGGSGLGLYISRELTELQGGLIGVSSRPNEGSTFGFYIKARRATLGEIEIHRPKKRSSLGVQQLSINPGGASPSTDEERVILLVEDNLINQKLLAKQLRRLGCIVHVANHGLEALDFIKTTRYWKGNAGNGSDLTAILMDWEMPICDGLAATRQLRDMEHQGLIVEHLPVIMATANARPGQIDVAHNAGCDDFITKPFTVTQVMQKIDHWTCAETFA